ncbi:MAG TPA: DUF1934 domain-containing protein [Candidatus Enterocloster faecavium]|uniref:DUF1934 domain-containing protein n=1 Tax=Candidatus Enterocloster faecavium TaxID=2838560 RepID=A0A9D2L8B3_9FIRM|nr:DUF1934 domain-containing protein [Candidatus Enterocloster faecavium]
MTKDVLITISGVQMLDEEDADVEMVTRGDYYQKNGKHYILYDEVMEGFDGRVRNVIKISPDSVDIIKQGAASAHMQFEKNKKNLSCYTTPLGDLMIGIQANRISIDEGEDHLKINVEYSLDINYQHASECNISVNVQSVWKFRQIQNAAAKMFCSKTGAGMIHLSHTGP